MRRTVSALAIVLLSGTVALAQGGGGGGSGGGSGGASGSGSSSSGSSSSGTTSSPTGPGTSGPNNTSNSVPGISTPSATDTSTTGRAPGVNPANPQDARRRSNPSDRTLPAARNPQDMAPLDNSTPQIMAPERR